MKKVQQSPSLKAAVTMADNLAGEVTKIEAALQSVQGERAAIDADLTQVQNELIEVERKGAVDGDVKDAERTRKRVLTVHQNLEINSARLEALDRALTEKRLEFSEAVTALQGETTKAGAEIAEAFIRDELTPAVENFRETLHRGMAVATGANHHRLNRLIRDAWFGAVDSPERNHLSFKSWRDSESAEKLHSQVMGHRQDSLRLTELQRQAEQPVAAQD